MTRKQMADQVKYWLGLQDIDSFNEVTFVYDLLYQGTIDLLARTRCVARCVNLHVTAGVDTYLADQGILSFIDIEDGSRRRARRDQSFTPSFTLIRSDLLRFNAVPTEDGDIQTWAVLRPAQMTADTDSVSQEQFGAIPEDYQDAIVTYALWKGSDYADDQTGGQGERYRNLYEGPDGRGGRLAQIRVSVNKRGTARAPDRRVTVKASMSRQAWVG